MRLSRFAGVSGAGDRRRNPERSEGSAAGFLLFNYQFLAIFADFGNDNHPLHVPCVTRLILSNFAHIPGHFCCSFDRTGRVSRSLSVPACLSARQFAVPLPLPPMYTHFHPRSPKLRQRVAGFAMLVWHRRPRRWSVGVRKCFRTPMLTAECCLLVFKELGLPNP